MRLDTEMAPEGGGELSRRERGCELEALIGRKCTHALARPARRIAWKSELQEHALEQSQQRDQHDDGGEHECRS